MKGLWTTPPAKSGWCMHAILMPPGNSHSSREQCMCVNLYLTKRGALVNRTQFFAFPQPRTRQCFVGQVCLSRSNPCPPKLSACIQFSLSECMSCGALSQSPIHSTVIASDWCSGGADSAIASSGNDNVYWSTKTNVTLNK